MANVTNMIVRFTGGILLVPSIYLSAIVMETFEKPSNPNTNGVGGIVAGLIVTPAICALVTGKPVFVLLNVGIITGILLVPQCFPWSY